MAKQTPPPGPISRAEVDIAAGDARHLVDDDRIFAAVDRDLRTLRALPPKDADLFARFCMAVAREFPGATVTQDGPQFVWHIPAPCPPASAPTAGMTQGFPGARGVDIRPEDEPGYKPNPSPEPKPSTSTVADCNGQSWHRNPFSQDLWQCVGDPSVLSRPGGFKWSEMGRWAPFGPRTGEGR